MRKRFVYFLVVLTLGRIALAQESSDMGTLQVTFAPEKPEYILGEPIILTFEITNQSETDIVVDLAWVRWGKIFFSSETKSEKIITKEEYQRGILQEVPPNIQLKPNANFKQSIILDKWLIFAEPGLYTIKCSLRIKDEMLGNMLPIKILSTDPVQLCSLADSMLAKLEKAVYIEALHVPNCEVIKAFRRIGGPEAIDALRELSNSTNSRTAHVAKGELGLLERGIKREPVIAD